MAALYSPSGELAAAGGRGTDDAQTYFQSLTPGRQKRYEEAINGPSPTAQRVLQYRGVALPYHATGCWAASVKAVYGTVRAALWDLAVAEYALGRVARETAEATHPDAVKWSRCVFDSTRLRFANPTVAVEQVESRYQQRGDTDAVREYERFVAVADGRCEYETGLAGDYSRAFRQFAGALPWKVLRDLARASHAEHAANRRSIQLMQRRGPSASN